MIDEKKLIEERPEWLNTDCVGSEKYNKGWNDCNKYWCNTIKRQPKFDKWIPCSERLPEEPNENPLFENKHLELYLVTTGYGSTEQDKVYPFRAFWNGVNFTDGWNFLDVIAWQPLPEPYRRDQNVRRLTARNRKGYAYFPQCFEEPCCGFGCQIEPCEFISQVCEKLAQYEDTEERGEDHDKGGSSQRTTIPETGEEEETEKA